MEKRIVTFNQEKKEAFLTGQNISTEKTEISEQCIQFNVKKKKNMPPNTTYV